MLLWSKDAQMILELGCASLKISAGFSCFVPPVRMTMGRMDGGYQLFMMILCDEKWSQPLSQKRQWNFFADAGLPA